MLDEARDRSGEEFKAFMSELYARIRALIEAGGGGGLGAGSAGRSVPNNFGMGALSGFPPAAQRLGGIRAIDALIDVRLGEDSGKISRFASYLRDVFQPSSDAATMRAAAIALGRLARTGGSLAADVVEIEVRRALEWLHGEHSEARRYAAVLVLRELAENAPTVFNVHVPAFIDGVWVALRDKRLHVRVAAVLAVRACLVVVEKRETRYRVQHYYRMFANCEAGLGSNASVESIHGSLLTTGELLRYTGEFMLARYADVAQTVLRHRDHRERMIRHCVAQVLPRVAHFSPERFARDYLPQALAHLLGVMRSDKPERGVGFLSLAEVAQAVGRDLVPHLKPIVAQLHDGITPKRGRPFCPEALTAIGALTEAIGRPMAEPCAQLLPLMFNGGLQPTLVDALTQLSASLPALLPFIRERLLDMLSLVLAKRPYKPNGGVKVQPAVPEAAPSGGFGLGALSIGSSPEPPSSVPHGANLVRLALRTLSSFDLEAAPLLDFVHECVLPYLDAEEAATRRAASVACCAIMARAGGCVAPASEAGAGSINSAAAAAGGLAHASNGAATVLPSSKSSADARRGASALRRRAALVDDIMDRVLACAVTDVDVNVRAATLEVLAGEGRAFDAHLARAAALRALFVTLNDEALAVRVLAVRLCGRLSYLNPAYVLPALRQHLLQLLEDLESAADSKHREESAILLGVLMRSCTRLVLPYVGPMLKALVAKLRDGANISGRLRSSGGGAGANGGAGGGSARGVTGSAVGIVGVGGGKDKGGASTSGSLLGSSAVGFRGLALGQGVSARAGPGVVAATLGTVGELARVSGPILQPYVSELLPLVIGALRGDGDAAGTRDAAVATLGQLVASTGFVMRPYMDYPHLLSVLLRMLSGDLPWATRREAIRCLGIIGALDPAVHKRNLHELASGSRTVINGAGGKAKAKAKADKNGGRGQGGGGGGGGGGGIAVTGDGSDGGALAAQQAAAASALAWAGGADGGAGAGGDGEGAAILAELLPSAGLTTLSGEYYPTVALNALMRVLRDRSQGHHHMMVVRSLMFIFRALGLGCVPYLPRIIPALLQVLRTCEGGLREFILNQLPSLVAVMRQHARRYLDDLLEVVHEYWDAPPELRPHLLRLLEELSVALGDEFQAYLHTIVPQLVGALAEAERSGDFSAVPAVLHALEAFGRSLSEHFHLVLPALVRLFKSGAAGAGAPVRVRIDAVRSLKRLLPHMPVSAFASAIAHPLIRAVEEGPASVRAAAPEALCALAAALGSDFGIFAPLLRRVLERTGVNHPHLEAALAAAVAGRNPCEVLPPSYLGSMTSGGGMDTGDAADGTDGDTAAAAAAASGGDGSNLKLAVSEQKLQMAWESSQRSTKEDWSEWMRNFAVELLKESPSPALRACASLAQLQPHVARDLFASAFVSCWTELHEGYKEQLVRSLETALSSPTFPAEIVATILNLAEFMEHDERALPINIRTLGALAQKCSAFAKALHYKELEFGNNTPTASTVEALISVNNQLHLPQAANGILVHAQRHLNMELRESWYEKLNQWEQALAAYERKAAGAEDIKQALEAAFGQMRALAALGEWERLGGLCRDTWRGAELVARCEMASLAATAAWHLGEWEEMSEYVSVLDESPAGGGGAGGGMLHSVGGAAAATGVNAGSPRPLRVGSSVASATGLPAMGSQSDGDFFRAVLAVRSGRLEAARAHVDSARAYIATELAAVVGESYERAYGQLVRVQQLVELEECLEYSDLERQRLREQQRSHGGVPAAAALGEAAPPAVRQALIRAAWRERLAGAERSIEVWQSIVAVRSLVLHPTADIPTHLKFASLCRRAGRAEQGRRTLVRLLGFDPEEAPAESQAALARAFPITRGGDPAVALAYLKHVWHTGGRESAFGMLQALAGELHARAVGAAAAAASSTPYQGPPPANAQLLAKMHLKLGMWRWALSPTLDDAAVAEILASLRSATDSSRGWAKAWHQWALFNVEAMDHYSRANPNAAARHVAPAVAGFFRSIALSGSGRTQGGSLQDILRLLTLWFEHGAAPDVEMALRDGFGHISISTWLAVLPQIIARIHSSSLPVRTLIHHLLVRIGRHHPQALMYPLLVACKSSKPSRAAAAMAVMDNVRQHSALLVEQASLVSQELIRIAILWHESWHEALEEASRLYFGDHNIQGMLATLAPLHQQMERQGPETLKEIAFVQAYGRELHEANEWCSKYKHTGREAELNQAWDLYYHVFKRINKQLPSLTMLELQYVSPRLVAANSLELAVPGIYTAGAPVVTIESFSPQLQVITSKQRPRKLSIVGSDGQEYSFLLKGHEDLRQDERVMQLFGLVNTLLADDPDSATLDLGIHTYSVVPLSQNSGLISWVKDCDTLHSLIREYREARKIPLNIEHRLMLSMSPDYELLTLLAKVEVFRHALNNTEGNDLARIVWLKSRSSEVWLSRRTNYTRSLATMSMVGYLLGLGDRHPSNITLDRLTGKCMHIDFGDCFESAMKREKVPERVPFRLTRMLIKAMEVSGIEGNFRSTCEVVMGVLRSNKDSVLAMLETFVHDPLINWKLVGDLADVSGGSGSGGHAHMGAHAGVGHHQKARAATLDAVGQAAAVPPLAAANGGAEPAGEVGEILNERAVAVIRRVSDKLHGRDFAPEGEVVEPGDELDVPEQVQQLIEQATSDENLSQSYVGWWYVLALLFGCALARARLHCAHVFSSICALRSMPARADSTLPLRSSVRTPKQRLLVGETGIALIITHYKHTCRSHGVPTPDGVREPRRRLEARRGGPSVPGFAAPLDVRALARPAARRLCPRLLRVRLLPPPLLELPQHAARRALVVASRHAHGRHHAALAEHRLEGAHGVGRRRQQARRAGVLVELDEVHLGAHRVARQQVGEAVGVGLRVVHAAQQHVLEQHAVTCALLLLRPGTAPLTPWVELGERRHELLEAVLAVDGHQPVSRLVVGGVEADGERGGRARAQLANLRHETRRRHGDAPPRQRHAGVVRQDVHRAQHLLQVVQGLAHAHEHTVPRARPHRRPRTPRVVLPVLLSRIGERALLLGDEALGFDHLLHDVRRAQVGAQPHARRVAELAVHRAA